MPKGNPEYQPTLDQHMLFYFHEIDLGGEASIPMIANAQDECADAHSSEALPFLNENALSCEMHS